MLPAPSESCGIAEFARRNATFLLDTPVNLVNVSNSNSLRLFAQGVRGHWVSYLQLDMDCVPPLTGSGCCGHPRLTLLTGATVQVFWDKILGRPHRWVPFLPFKFSGGFEDLMPLRKDLETKQARSAPESVCPEVLTLHNWPESRQAVPDASTGQTSPDVRRPCSLDSFWCVCPPLFVRELPPCT